MRRLFFILLVVPLAVATENLVGRALRIVDGDTVYVLGPPTPSTRYAWRASTPPSAGIRSGHGRSSV
jgi:hypothetical protein